MRQEEYTDRDGAVRAKLEVNATDARFLGPRGGEDRIYTPEEKQARREALAAARQDLAEGRLRALLKQ